MKQQITLLALLFTGFFSIAQSEEDYTVVKDGVVFFDELKEVKAEYYYKDDSFIYEDYEIEDNKISEDGEELVSFRGRKLELEGNEYVFRGKFMSLKKAKVIDKNSGEVLFTIRKTKKLFPNAIEITEVNQFELSEEAQELFEVWLLFQEGKWLKNKTETLEAISTGVGAGVMSAVMVSTLRN